MVLLPYTHFSFNNQHIHVGKGDSLTKTTFWADLGPFGQVVEGSLSAI